MQPRLASEADAIQARENTRQPPGKWPAIVGWWPFDTALNFGLSEDCHSSGGFVEGSEDHHHFLTFYACSALISFDSYGSSHLSDLLFWRQYPGSNELWHFSLLFRLFERNEH